MNNTHTHTCPLQPKNAGSPCSLSRRNSEAQRLENQSNEPTAKSLPSTGFQCLPYSGWVELVKINMILTPDSSP